MTNIQRFGQDRTPVQKTGTDKIFGTGIDGTVTISTNTSLSRDMYYANLTVNSSVTLFTNGFKIFVSGTLTNNGTIGMPKGTAQTTSVLAGTVLTRVDAPASWSANQSIDSANSSGNLAFNNTKGFENILEGVYATGTGINRFFAGTQGTAGTANPGNAGSGGNSTAGNPGTAGSSGLGGGTVAVIAKAISGSGTFISEGTDGTSGSNGNAGTTQTGTSFHNPSGHAHAPAHAPGHNPGSHNPAQSFHHPAGCCAWNGAHHHDHGSHHHVNQNAWHHPGNQYHYQYHYSHSHPGNPGHNPTYPGGTGGTGNPGNPGKGGGLYVLTRGISTHIASGDMTYVEDLDD